LAYWLADHTRGVGIAGSTVRLVCRWAFSELPTLRIEALVQPENVTSRKVLLRTGFTAEGTLRAFRIRHGVPIDLDSYSLLKGDPIQQP
jgi:ribosomal-protein-alanine N-acetyltransferase